MKKKEIFFVMLFMVSILSIKAQDYTHKWYVKGGLGIGFGLNHVDLKRTYTDQNGTGELVYGLDPGSTIAPSLSIGKNIYENLSGQLTLVYNINYTYEAQYSSQSEPVEISHGFSRFGIMLEGNYYLTIIEDKWALVPTVGLGIFIPGDLFLKTPFYEQVVSYSAAPSAKIGMELQKSWKGKWSIGFGGFYQVENYKAKSVRYGELSDQDPNIQNLNASNFGIMVNIVFPIVQNTKMGHMKNVFK